MADSFIVLVVDDNDATLKTLGDFLKISGYQVILANDGKEAWDIICSRIHDIGVLITDYMMPNLDGEGLIRNIRLAKIDIPLVILSSATIKTNQTLLDLSRELNIRLLPKPFECDDLLDLISSSVRTQRKVSTKSDI